jgi:hypothetical protein
MGGPIINPAFTPAGETAFNTSIKPAYDGGSGPGGPGVGVDNLLLVESGDNILRVEDASCVILRVE